MLLHLGVLLFYGVMALAFLARLLPVWGSHIPGGLQDTRFLLWNDWWFRYAIDTLHTNPFHTQLLFHPFGTSLVLTDSPFWNSLVTYLAQHQGAGLIASANLSFVLSWILMGFVTYLLAWEITRERMPSLVAGLFVMTHSFVLACTMQNWTRFNLYGIPLFIWALVRARRSGRHRDFILAGLALAWTAACHYYFLIYSLLIWSAVFIADYFPYGLSAMRRLKRPLWGKFLLGFSVLAGLISSWIIVGHPADIMLGTMHIGMETPYNTLLVMWLALFLGWASRWETSLYRRDQAAMKPLESLANQALLLGTAGVFLLPLLIPIVRMVLHGEYPRQTILWKTHRPGANLFSLFLPNPTQVWWGPAISRWFTSRGMIVQEETAGLGWVFLVLLVTSRPWEMGRAAKRWIALGAASTLLAMGSYLHIAQWNLWMPLPFYFLRLVPVVGNVRVPSHWMAVGSVACAVVAALGLTRLAREKKWSLSALSIIVGALILVENWPGITIAQPPAPEAIYETLRGLPPGGVLTIPLYIGDSSIGAGDAINNQFIFPWDHLWAQTTHEKPILGGYIGRISRHMIDHYKADPFIHTLLDLEEGKIHHQSAEPAFGEYAYRNLDFRYVLVYPASTNPEALQYALESLPLEFIEQNASVQLYRIKSD